MADHEVAWETCTAVDDCAGVRLPTGQKCWAHAADADLDAALKRLGEDGRLDARGVPITQELLGRLLAAAPHDDHGHPILTDTRFHNAAFQGDARFSGASFQGTAGFDMATFQGTAWFFDVTFQGDARFDMATFFQDAGFGGASFQGEAWFDGATFQGTAWFRRATFQDAARFRGASFQGEAGFDWGTAFQATAWFAGTTFQATAGFRGTTFQATAWFAVASFQATAGFDGASFQGDAWFAVASFQATARFGGASFRGDARFGEASFQGDVGFGGASFQGDAGFDMATFQRARQLGPMLVRNGLVLDLAVFHERAQIEVAAAAVCCRRTRFLAGAQLRVRWARVVLDDADLAAPSLLAGVSDPFPGLEEGRWAHALERLQRLRAISGPRGSRPWLVSVRRADVAGLTVAGVDLRACRFTGAHHLDQLRIEESAFASTPSGWRWTSRQTIAEEHQWRAAHPHPSRQPTTPATATPRTTGPHAGWYQPAHRPPAWLERVELPTPAQIAALYRALRKGREDNKDEPGAADFYYGEMEMRRHDPTKPTAERLVLLGYWLFCGYALRASRALAWLLGVLAVATVLLAAQGLEQPAAGWSFAARLGTAALVAVEGAVFRASEQQLTYTGRLIQAILRFAGPILLGLTVLSIRGRVKR